MLFRRIQSGFKCNCVSHLEEVQHKSFGNFPSVTSLCCLLVFSCLVMETTGHKRNLIRASNTMWWFPVLGGLQG